MRMRRHFQPTLDSMPVRIAPAAIGAMADIAAPIITMAPTPAAPVTALDTDPPEGGLAPIIIEPIMPPTTIMS